MLLSRTAEMQLDAAIQKILVENLLAVPLSRSLQGWFVTREAAAMSEIFILRDVDGQRFFVGSLALATAKSTDESGGEGNE